MIYPKVFPSGFLILSITKFQGWTKAFCYLMDNGQKAVLESGRLFGFSIYAALKKNDYLQSWVKPLPINAMGLESDAWIKNSLM